MGDLATRLAARPLYLQVRDVLVNMITDGEWKPGASIPNESLLASQMQISIGTVRKALDLMAQERIVTRRQGRGTFVNDYGAKDAPSFFSTLFDSTERPLIDSKRSKAIERIAVKGTEAVKLALHEGDEAIKVERLRLRDGKCFMVETCLLPAKLYRTLPEDLGNYRLSALAQQNSLVVGRAVERVDIVLADESDAHDLEVAPGTPLLRLDRRIFSDHQQTLEWRIARCFLRNERYLVKFN